MELETKYCGSAGALSVTEGHVISGYASLFGIADQGGDEVLAGAYGTALEQLRARGQRIKMLWQHDPAQPIGVWDEACEDDRGLWVKGRILTELTQGREAAALLTAGALDGLSIGYRTKRAERAGGVRRLAEIELWEVSLVTFPMLPEARVAGKGDSPDARALQELAQAFRAARAMFT